MRPGDTEIERAASELASHLPGPLRVLARLAYNYRWSWLPGGAEVFASVDAHRWETYGENPVRLLHNASAGALADAAADGALVARAARLEQAVRADLERPDSDGPTVAFFCAEFAVHTSLPIYSGGLGALAGDFLKEASDRALPLVGVGLLYRQGYFRQRVDAGGVQHEYWIDTDPSSLPAALVLGEDGRPVTVTVPIRTGEVTAQIWRVDVGRTPLYLLDTDRPENDLIGRWTTARLYTANPDIRLAQYALLGIGGMRALAALGIEPDVVHLNEGHAALAFLGAASAEGTRTRTVFTTHTPVAAGNDTYPPERALEILGAAAAAAGIDGDALIRLGRTHPDDPGEPFGMTQLALRTSRSANGVSRRHGEVARGMWRELWPDRPVEEVPITHVTNGVHVPTWLGAPMHRLLHRWAAVDDIPDAELWAARQEQRAVLVRYVRDRSVADRLARDEPRDYVIAADRAFDAEVLTIGFARRIAAYKRLHLLVYDVERVTRLLGGSPPVQIVLAGKAHPRDGDAKALLQGLFAAKGVPHVGERVVFLEDYEVGVASRLVQGCDLWVNLPRPPLEASGTSGMKSAVNGGLNLSVLDGWWAEAYDGANGWALPGEVDDDHASQDARDSAELYRLLEEEVVPSFYDRDADGIPRAWLARVRASLRTLPHAFGAGRMLDEYAARVYIPGATGEA